MALQPEADRPEVRELARAAQSLLQYCAEHKILTARDYTTAAEWLKQVKGKQKELKALRETVTKPLNAALRAARDLFNEPESVLMDAEDFLKHAMSEYNAEQERLRKEEQCALDEAAERERRQLQAEAVNAARRGDADEAAHLADRAAMVVAPVIPHEAPRVAGIAQRELWRAEVTDLRALVLAVASGSVPLAALTANSTFLNGQARALREELRYPGVRAIPERSIAAGSA